jgi:zinc transport system substrate-binding protein
MKRTTRALSVTLTAVLALAACSTSPARTFTPVPTEITVTAAFYPLQFVAELVGGARVTVTALAPPGVEPHDLELSPAAVRSVRDSDVVLYLAGFQASIDDAISTTDAHSLDVADSVTLLPAPEGIALAFDPHFWLDPTLLAEYATAVGEEFASLDPAHADEYRANAVALGVDLATTNAAYAERLASCERTTLLTSHEAFGYLAARYGLTQIGLSGLDPEAEPSPARIREVRDIAESTGATTVFVETIVDPSVVEAFAHDANLAVATLDPIESLTDPADDYLIVATRNLEALSAGLGCG